jgi:hypothetical protein
MRLYERILQEAAQQKDKEDPEREEQQRMRDRKHQKLRSYIRRRAVPESSGYLTSEEARKEQERHLADLQALGDLLICGVRSLGAGYRLALLRSKYPMEYAHLRDIEISSEWGNSTSQRS